MRWWFWLGLALLVLPSPIWRSKWGWSYKNKTSQRTLDGKVQWTLNGLWLQVPLALWLLWSACR